LLTRPCGDDAFQEEISEEELQGLLSTKHGRTIFKEDCLDAAYRASVNLETVLQDIGSKMVRSSCLQSIILINFPFCVPAFRASITTCYPATEIASTALTLPSTKLPGTVTPIQTTSR
jgi:hypothetical protein